MLKNDKLFTHKSHEPLKRVRQLLSTHIFKALFVMLSVVSLVWVGQKLSLFPIRYVKIVGSNSVALNTALRQTVEPLMQDRSRRINLSMLESELKQWTCVERIVLWPILPYTLIIHLSIREPVAIFEATDKGSDPKTQWIDRRGFLFNSSTKLVTTHLPKLIGPKEQSTQLLKQYQALYALLKPHALEVAIVRLDNENRCSLVLNNGIELLLGHLEPLKKLQQLLDKEPLVLHQADKISKLDLRYPTGMAITFRQAAL